MRSERIIRRVQRIGPVSLALILPKQFVKELGITLGDYVEITCENETLYVRLLELNPKESPET